jgi:hypothetical protein
LSVAASLCTPNKSTRAFSERNAHTLALRKNVPVHVVGHPGCRQFPSPRRQCSVGTKVTSTRPRKAWWWRSLSLGPWWAARWLE